MAYSSALEMSTDICSSFTLTEEVRIKDSSTNNVGNASLTNETKITTTTPKLRYFVTGGVGRVKLIVLHDQKWKIVLRGQK